MATRKISLPSLKVTRRPSSGKTSVEHYQREVGLSDLQPVLLKDASESNQCTSTKELDDMGNSALFSDLEEPTGHELESRASIAGWDSVRRAIRTAVTEMAAMPLSQICLCCDTPASMRCKRCGPKGYYCQECFIRCHSEVNFFHVAEKWECDHFVPFVRDDLKIDVNPFHQCTTKKASHIQCIDEYGMEHKVLFTSCGCEPFAVTLARAELWPATPTNPHYAFSFFLLDWAEALLLEAQVSLKDFCKTLKFLCPFHLLKKRNIYSALINSFEEYRHKLRHLDYVADNIDSGNVCPACSQSGGKVVYAMDALFGLPRKKSAGVSHRDPLHTDLVFCDQAAVDQFVVDSEPVKMSPPSVCNDFLAGNVLRSANRYMALDETAVFGYCCRHEFPGEFVNLKHGERLAYGVWILERIQQKMQLKHITQTYVMYDIACTLFNHLQKLGTSDILNNIHLCLPIFHCYGHKVSCQILFGPRRCEGIGLSDGETMERLWSYLRRFSRMTKEMRPAHRIDVLTSALVYYGIQTKEKLATLVLARLERAIKTKAIAEETLNQLMSGPFEEKESKVKRWLFEEEANYSNPSKSQSKSSHWHNVYFQSLHTYYSLRNQVASGNAGATNVSNYGKLSWLDKHLVEFEKKHCISQRWLPSDQVYKECEYFITFTKREQLILQIWKCSQRRMFLLKLKKKYADGQKVAKKLCYQISKETKSIKSLLEEYHACQSVGDTSGDISLSEALDPSSIADRLKSFSALANTAISGEKQEAIQAYLSLCRSKEEISMLKDDAQNMVKYYECQREVVCDELLQLSTKMDPFSRGSTSLLCFLLSKIDYLLKQGCLTLQTMTLMISELPSPISDDDDDDDDEYFITTNDCSSDDDDLY